MKHFILISKTILFCVASIVFTASCVSGVTSDEKEDLPDINTIVLPENPVHEFMEFWGQQRRGANGNLKKRRPDWFQAAGDAGIDIIRFNPTWIDSKSKNFLIGDVDSFTGIVEEDVDLLIECLDEAYKNNVYIILTMFELPGRKCPNELAIADNDYRLWQDEHFQMQAAEFWQQLAGKVKDHPAIVAYDLINEPHPERAFGFEYDSPEFKKWYQANRNTSWDVNRFNRNMIKAIREVDSETPIVVEGYFYASPISMNYLEPIDDPGIIYSFHNPLPWEFTAYRANKGRFSYPDALPGSEWNGPTEEWTLERIKEEIRPVLNFMVKHSIPAHQMYGAEVWCDRRVAGCAEALSDVFAVYNEYNFHWSLYGFREDMAWTGLNYEIGTEAEGWKYWDRIEQGEDYYELQKEMRKPNPIWDVIQKALKGKTL